MTAWQCVLGRRRVEPQGCLHGLHRLPTIAWRGACGPSRWCALGGWREWGWASHVQRLERTCYHRCEARGAWVPREREGGCRGPPRSRRWGVRERHRRRVRVRRQRMRFGRLAIQSIERRAGSSLGVHVVRRGRARISGAGGRRKPGANEALGFQAVIYGALLPYRYIIYISVHPPYFVFTVQLYSTQQRSYSFVLSMCWFVISLRFLT